MHAGTRWAGKKERKDPEKRDGLVFDDNCQEGVLKLALSGWFDWFGVRLSLVQYGVL